MRLNSMRTGDYEVQHSWGIGAPFHANVNRNVWVLHQMCAMGTQQEAGPLAKAVRRWECLNVGAKHHMQHE